MDAVQLEALIDAFESSFAQAGVGDLYTGAKRLRAFVDRKYPMIRAAESRESLTAYFGAPDGAADARVQDFITLLGVLPRSWPNSQRALW